MWSDSVPGRWVRLAQMARSVYWPGRRTVPASLAGDGNRVKRHLVDNRPTEGPEMPFYFFFGLLGLVIGGLLTWFFLADHPFESLETPGGPVDLLEAGLLAKELAADGIEIDETTIVRLLNLHGAYVDGRIREAQVAAEAERIDADLRQARQEKAGGDAG